MDLKTRLLASPDFFAQKIDFLQRLVLFIHFSRDLYRQSSFLDDRILTPQTKGSWVRFDEVNAALAGVEPARPLHFIFHAGHVGSTLLSRLIEDAGGVLALREPLTLRTLADAEGALHEPYSLVSPADFDALLRGQIVLWRRGYDDTRAVILKATSTAIRLAPRLLAASADSRAVCLNLALEPYLATLLAGENSIVDLRGHGEGRIRRLQLFGIEPRAPLHAMSAGEMAALAWTVESLSQARLKEAFGDRILVLDFDAFLNDVGAILERVCTHFGISAPRSFFTEAANSPVLQAYAKAPEAAYSPAVRAAQLDRARTMQANEIRRGLDWVDELARRSGAVAGLLRSAP